MSRTQKKKSNGWLRIIIFFVLLAFIATAGFYAYQEWIVYEHPIEYSKYVERYSREFGLDKYLVYAIIKTESGYDSRSVSNVGARGLMQIMEDSFDWIKFKLGDEDTQYSDMFDPEQNIRYGCYLMGYLYDEFGNVEAAAAAYHAGRGAVNSWLEDPAYSSDGLHLDVIPISDTAHYVNKITKALKTYKELYQYN